MDYWLWLQENQGPLVAIGTVALAALTGLYVVRTGRLAKSAERSASSSERLVQLEVLPVVLSRPGARSSSSKGASVRFEYRNVGKGVALNVSAQIEMADGTNHEELIALILAPSQEVKRAVDVSHQAMEQINSATIWVEYGDSLGNSYRSKIVPEGYRAELFQRLDDGGWRQIVM